MHVFSYLSDEDTESLNRLSTMPPLVAPPHMVVDSAYMDLTSLLEASDLSLLLSTTLLLSSGKGCCCSAAFDVTLLTVGSFFSAVSDSFSSATFESGGGESQIEEDDDEAESASPELPELTPDELGVLQRISYVVTYTSNTVY